MNEEERIREDIARTLAEGDGWNWDMMAETEELAGSDEIGRDSYYKITDQILSIKGIRIEADNQKLPENYHNKASLIITYNTAQQDMLKAGFVKCQEGKEKWGVKPVNKEEHGS